ncbi:Os03g0340601 [Oryza sativa Japonica Group]|uniref:Os03g0340601 protein n=1 Tax=Oryza sativa subsp. japonica TaxID=39947 RepID=A0A0P0VX82_ORYSJ|nr:hypothetical protein EE612_017311 [Oryza sativa]BAS84120.1 Os03g0340601 [Oryza sativa Japonica Group]
MLRRKLAVIGTMSISYVAIELTIASPVRLSRDPTELPKQVIGLNKFMHLLNLCDFFSVLGFLDIVIASNHDKVYQLPQPSVFSISFNQPCYVLNSVKSCHGKENGF